MSFQLFSIPVHIHPSFWLFLLLFVYGTSPLQMALLIGVVSFSLWFHEYGHAAAARLYGRSPEIHMIAFGGHTTYNGVGLSAKQDFNITLCGPLFTILLISMAHLFLKLHLFQGYAANCFLHYLFRLNIFWGIANLLPLFPLDGGRLARYWLTSWLGDERGLRVSLVLGSLCAVGGAIYYFWAQSTYFAFLFLYYGFQNFQELLKKKSSAPNLFSQFSDAVAAVDREEHGRAKEILKKLLKSKDPYYRTRAIEETAQIFVKEGKRKEAYLLLRKENHEEMRKGKLLLCELALQEGEYQWIEKYGRDIYEIEPTFETACLNAKGFAGLMQPEMAAGWLWTAARFQENPQQEVERLAAEPMFVSVRQSPQFIETLGNLTRVALK